MDYEELLNCYSGVDVCLDWTMALDWKIESHILTSSDDIRRLRMPWYLKGDVCCRHSDDGAKPVTVGEVADNLAPWHCKLKRIYRHAFCFNRAKSQIQITFPAYYLQDGTSLLLDGNHRAVALVLREMDFKATLHSFHGPMDPKALPDLTHFMQKRPSS